MRALLLLLLSVPASAQNVSAPKSFSWLQLNGQNLTPNSVTWPDGSVSTSAFSSGGDPTAAHLASTQTFTAPNTFSQASAATPGVTISSGLSIQNGTVLIGTGTALANVTIGGATGLGSVAGSSNLLVINGGLAYNGNLMSFRQEGILGASIGLYFQNDAHLTFSPDGSTNVLAISTWAVNNELVINNAGVGINNANPAQALDVTGNGKVSGTLQVANYFLGLTLSTVTSCGANVTSVGNGNVGIATTGSSAVATCSITWTPACTTGSVCHFDDDSRTSLTGPSYVFGVNSATATFSGSWTQGDKISWQCGCY